MYSMRGTTIWPLRLCFMHCRGREAHEHVRKLFLFFFLHTLMMYITAAHGGRLLAAKTAAAAAGTNWIASSSSFLLCKGLLLGFFMSISFFHHCVSSWFECPLFVLSRIPSKLEKNKLKKFMLG